MVIELSGVQFGLKSKSDESAAQIRFEITSMISNQNCTTRNSIVNSNSKLFLTAGRVRKKKTEEKSENKVGTVDVMSYKILST